MFAASFRDYDRIVCLVNSIGKLATTGRLARGLRAIEQTW